MRCFLCVSVIMSISFYQFTNAENKTLKQSVVYTSFNSTEVPLNTGQLKLKSNSNFSYTNEIITDNIQLNKIKVQYNLPINPVIAWHTSNNNDNNDLYVIANKDNNVYLAKLTNKTISIEKLGYNLSVSHKSLKNYEKSIFNSKILIAWTSIYNEVTAISEANNLIYEVKQLEDKSFAINTFYK